MTKIKTKAYVELQVKTSPLHGKGLFAKSAIKKGAMIGKVSGRRTKQDSMYTLWLDEEQGFRVQCEFKYINHSRAPNVAYYDDLSVVALKTVPAGAELLHDYGEDFED